MVVVLFYGISTHGDQAINYSISLEDIICVLEGYRSLLHRARNIEHQNECSRYLITVNYYPCCIVFRETNKQSNNY